MVDETELFPFEAHYRCHLKSNHCPDTVGRTQIQTQAHVILLRHPTIYTYINEKSRSQIEKEQTKNR